MKVLCACAVVLVLACSTMADVPQTINHQGVIKVSGVPFSGTGHFKFAILNAPGVNVWTNDNSNLVLNGVPNTFEDVTVIDGVYSVILGGTAPGYTMTPIPATVFNEPNRRLRIFFDDGVNGPQQLTPDHELTSSPYSQQSAFQPPIGSIIAWHKSLPGVPALPDGWIECTQNGSGNVTINVPGSPLNGQLVPALNDTPTGYTGGGRFLRGGSTSGTLQDATVHFNLASSTLPMDAPTPWVRNGDRNQLLNVVGGSFLYNSENFPINFGAPYVASRPVNMSVVWIMRVK